MFSRIAVSAVILLASLLPAGIAAAAPADTDRLAARSVFYLIISPLEGHARSRTMLLTCDPPAFHPHAVTACAGLAAVDGRIERMTPASLACTLEYAPVRVSAYGWWHGKRRWYEAEFGNLCQARVYTGDVFRF